MAEQTITNNKRKWKFMHFELLSMCLFGVIFTLIFAYGPMFGTILAFKDADNKLNVLKAMFESDWAEMHGFYNFYRFLTDIDFKDILLNTIGFNLLSLFIRMPIPVILALMFSEVKGRYIGKTIQFFTFLPNFISAVVFISIVYSLLDDGYGGSVGVVNHILEKLGLVDTYINFKGSPQYSWAIMIISNIIKSAGWGTIPYLAAIAGVDTELYDAASIDGAGRFKKAWYITLPTIMSLFTLNLILNISGILNNDAGSMLLWQTQTNLERTEVISTYVIKYGINEMQYSFATAVGLWKSVLGTILILIANWISKKISGSGVIL